MKYCERKVFLEEKLLLKFIQPVSLRIAPALSFPGTWSLLCWFLKNWCYCVNPLSMESVIVENSGKCFFQNRQNHIFALKLRTVLPSSTASSLVSVSVKPTRHILWAERCLLGLCALGQNHLTVINPIVCPPREFAGTGAEGSFPIKAALNRREGLCFPVSFRRKALEPLCPLGCRGLWETHRAGQGTGKAV